MKAIALLFISTLFISCATKAPESLTTTTPEKKSIRISKYWSFKNCYNGDRKCIGPSVRRPDDYNVSLEMEPYSKTDEKGLTAYDTGTYNEGGVPFHYEIRINKLDSVDEYYIYMAVRSGPKFSRNGVVKTHKTKDLNTMERLTVTDRPIKYPRGELTASLTIGPPVKVAN